MNKKPHIIISSFPATTSTPSSTTQAPSAAPRRRSLFRPTPPSSSSTSIPSPSPQNTKDAPGPLVAEGRFDIHSTGTSIAYPIPPPPNHPVPPPQVQRLELFNPSAQVLITSISGQRHYWQPFAGNKSVFECLNEEEETVARFVQNPTPASSTSAVVGAGVGQGERARKKNTPGEEVVDVGELIIVESALPAPPATGEGDGGEGDRWKAREEVICSAIVVVERAKRRAANCGLSRLKGAYTAPVAGSTLGFVA